jgi:hypothetical protein
MEVKIMNKKVLGIALASIFLAMLVAPVMAGKGQTKVSFRFVVVGTYTAPAVVKLVGQSAHYIDMPFVALGWLGGDEPYTTPYAPLVLEIDGVPIDPELLSYEGMMQAGGSAKSDNGYVRVDEVITIGDGEGGEAGTIVLQVKGNNYANGNGVGQGDSFIGFGTGDFEGVKIQGRTPEGPVQVGDFPIPGSDPVEYVPISMLERVGTVMGWP